MLLISKIHFLGPGVGPCFLVLGLGVPLYPFKPKRVPFYHFHHLFLRFFILMPQLSPGSPGVLHLGEPDILMETTPNS